MDVPGRPPGEAPVLRAVAHQIATEETLRDFVETSAVGLHWVASDGTILWANRADHELLGYAADEYIGRNIVEFHADADVIADILARLTRGERLNGYQARLRCKDGSDRVVSIASSVRRDAEGNFLHTRCFTVDVSDRARAFEDAQVLATTLRCIGDGVISVDRDGRVRFINPVAQVFTGWTSEAATGKPLSEIFVIEHELTRQAVTSPVDIALGEDRIVELANHTVLRRPDGTEIAIEDSASPIRSELGEVTGAVLVFRDVTVKRRAAERREFLHRATALLARSLDYEETLSAIVALAVPEIADWCALDLAGDDGTVRRLKVAHVDAARVALAHRLSERYPPSPDSRRGALHVIRSGEAEFVPMLADDTLRAAAVDEEHHRLLAALGLRGYVIVPIRAGTRIAGAVTFVMAESRRELTEDDRLMAEEFAAYAAVALENARLYREATEAARAREELMAVVSHDLRNPLSVITMAAATLRSASPGNATDAGYQRLLDGIERNAQVMSSLIRDLLDVASIQSRNLAVEMEPHDVAAIVTDAVDSMQPLAADRAIVIDAMATAVPPAIHCDRDRVSQVFSNLIGNAIKFTPSGGRITVGADRAGDFVRFCVADTGAGIPAGVVARVFEPYVHGAVRTREGTGLGLGLYIAKGVVDAHGGRIWVDQTGPSGTTICFLLPMQPSRT